MLGAVGTSAKPQAARRESFVLIEAGMATEEGQLGVRSDIGVALAAAVGRQLTRRLAVEARLGGAVFGAPEQFVSPAGCFGVVPCIPPSPSSVHMVTFGGNAILSSASPRVAPLLLAGIGIRYITEAPTHGGESRPYAELGAGLATPIGAVSWRVNARIQVAPASGDLPRWTIPITTGVRF
jgi:hypothetical protein